MEKRIFTFLLIACALSSAQAEEPSDVDAFLDDLQRAGVNFFWDEANPANGLIYDRARYDAAEHPHDRVASMAGLGFGLTAICIGQERGWIDPDAAYERILTTLRFLWEDMPHVRGFYYHFVDIKTGDRRWNSELSTIDTALLIAGVLTVRQYYPGTEVADLATLIYERVEWPWMLTDQGVLSMGWKPEQGFLPHFWGYYSEHKILYLLALGSPTHPIDTEVWHNWRREPVVTYGGRTFLACPPLFTHQYSQTWFDFRNQRDAYANYHHNTVLATLAQREMFMDLSDVFPLFGENLWGLTASDGPNGYVAWGGPPITADPAVDGTVTPYAAGGAIAFAPEEALHTLQHMRDTYGEKVWGRYAYPVAFNPHTGWSAEDVIGIDIGVTVMSAENYRSEFVWDTFMQNPEVQLAMHLAGFTDIEPDLSASEKAYLRKLARDTWRSMDALVHTISGLPYNDLGQVENTSLNHIGLHLTAIVAAHELKIIGRPDALKQIEAVLQSIKRFRTWYGMPANWNALNGLTPAPEDTWVSPNEAAVLAAGLITAANAFPEIKGTVQPMIHYMEWEQFHDDKRNVLVGGYNHATDEFNMDWTLPHLAADSRLSVFLAIASERVPPTLWDALDRSTETRQHTEYYQPGWVGGGLYMAYMSGLWLDEQGTPALQSARNFAYAQIRQADQLGYPAWGWSASDSPEHGFLGWDGLRNEVVTPHASVLAIEQYPREVVANLRTLESMGARNEEYGFYDAINLETSEAVRNILHRHQCMILIALANYLEDNVVRNHFQSDSLVQRGRALITDFQEPVFTTNRSVFTLQPPPTDLRAREQKTATAKRVGNWDNAEWFEMTHANAYDSGSRTAQNDVSAKIAFAWDNRHLHFKANLKTRAVENAHTAEEMFKGSCVELFIDPKNDGLRWGNRNDFQFGFSVENRAWEWFGRRHSSVIVSSTATEDGYMVHAQIPWQTLGITPKRGTRLQVSPAINSVNAADNTTLKLNWNWKPVGPVVRLGLLELR